MTQRALYAGSFDPITLGHIDIIRRAMYLFDEVVVAVAQNTQKSCMFSIDQRVAMVQAACQGTQVIVETYGGLTVDYARESGITTLVRGLRSAADFEAEKPLAQMNAQIADGIETVFLASQPQHAAISSSLVRELITMRAYDRLDAFLPVSVIELIQSHA